MVCHSRSTDNRPQTQTDFFRVEDAKSVALAGIDSVAVFTAMGDKAILVRNYHLKLKKSGERVRLLCVRLLVVGRTQSLIESPHPPT